MGSPCIFEYFFCEPEKKREENNGVKFIVLVACRDLERKFLHNRLHLSHSCVFILVSRSIPWL